MSAPTRPFDSRRIAFAAAFVVAVDQLSFSILIPVLPFVLLHFGASAAVVTQLVAVAGLAAFVGGPLVGWLSDRFGRIRALRLTLLASVVAQLGMLLSWSLPGLFLFRTLGGLLSGRGGILRAWVTDGAPREEHTLRLGWLATASSVGLASGPMLGGGLTLAFRTPESHYRATLLTAALLACAALVVTLTWGERVGVEAPAPATSPPSRVGPALLASLCWPMALVAATAYAFAVLASTTALLVHARFGWRELGAGALLGWSATIMIVSRAVLIPRLLSAIGNRNATFLALVLAAPALAAIGLARDPIVFLGAFSLFCLSASLTSVTPMALVSMAAPEARRGEAMGWAIGVSAIAAAASASLNGPLFAFVGPGMPHLVGAGAEIVAIAILLGARLGDAGPVMRPRAYAPDRKVPS